MFFRETKLFLTFCITVILSQGIQAFEKELTVTVEAGSNICFFQNVKEGYIIDVEYQVIDGGHGDLDINFQLAEPGGRIIYADFKKSEQIHRAEAKFEGDYKFCFDNSFSSFNSKTVYFELTLEKADGDDIDDASWGNLMDGLTSEEFYEMKIQDIQDSVSKVKTQLSKVRHLQDLIRLHEARDRNVAEETFHKVNSWSIVQIVIMLVVGLIQVITVKSLFDENSVIHKFLRQMK